MPVKDRTCEICKEEKTTRDFRRAQMICKVCESDSNVRYQKTCNQCNETKENTMFRKNRLKCLDCERAHGRNYRRTTTKAQEWTENNKERMAELQHNWYEENKSSIRKNEQDRLQNDAKFRKIKFHRVSIQATIRGKIKSNKQLKINRDDFLLWLKFCHSGKEFKIEDYGTVWNIDHVLPLDLLLNEDKHVEEMKIIKKENVQETIYCWYNITPLAHKENRDKSNNVSQEHLISHLKNLNTFLRKNKNMHEQMKDNEQFFKYKKTVQKIIDTCY